MSGLPFLGITVGMILAVGYTVLDSQRYNRIVNKSHNRIVLPEQRLIPAIVGSIFLPVGLFCFAWTNSRNIHWIVSIIGAAIFGFGIVPVFLSILNYVIDSYTVYAASALAANAVLRSLVGAGFPLFTNHLYGSLGIHWGSSIPAFLTLIFLPLPLLFFKYGPAIRQYCKYSTEATEIMRRMQERSHR